MARPLRREDNPGMTSDPRALLGRALDQSTLLIAGTRCDQLAEPTPCTEFDVRALLGHIVAVVHRIAHVGRGGDPFAVPEIVTDVDDWGVAVAAGRADLDAVWADEALLDTEFTVPWAASTRGRDALAVWTQELVTHAWDLARATGRTGELDPELGQSALKIAQHFIPAEPRGGQIPFGPVVTAAPNADAYTRLVAYLGREP